jgi:hypothetical protein
MKSPIRYFGGKGGMGGGDLGGAMPAIKDSARLVFGADLCEEVNACRKTASSNGFS